MNTIPASFCRLSAILTMIIFLLCAGTPGTSALKNKEDSRENKYNIPRVRPYEQWEPGKQNQEAARRDGTLTPLPGGQETQEEGYDSKGPRSDMPEDGGEVPTDSLEEDIIDPWEEYQEPGYPNDSEDDVWKFQKADEKADE